jgi:hypothetical protein
MKNKEQFSQEELKQIFRALISRELDLEYRMKNNYTKGSKRFKSAQKQLEILKVVQDKLLEHYEAEINLKSVEE